MSSWRKERGCSGKWHFREKRDAIRAARKARKRTGHGNIFPYSCPDCGEWHIGHHAVGKR